MPRRVCRTIRRSSISVFIMLGIILSHPVPLIHLAKSMTASQLSIQEKDFDLSAHGIYRTLAFQGMGQESPGWQGR